MKTITLDLPDKKLHPNGGSGWNKYAIAKLKKETHKRAWAIALRDIGKLPWAKVRISYTAYFSSKTGAALADKDNFIAWMKKYQDGIAHAVGINDKHFEVGTVDIYADPSRPRVVVVLTEVA